jgi:hypothetical protein
VVAITLVRFRNRGERASRAKALAMKSVVRLPVVLAVISCLFLSACDNGDLPPATQFSSVHGIVTDATTHQPIAGASVIVDTVLAATTDATGAFTIAKVPSGIVDYVVQAKGYADMTASFDAEPGKPFELNVAMQQPTPP